MAVKETTILAPFNFFMKQRIKLFSDNFLLTDGILKLEGSENYAGLCLGPEEYNDFTI